MTTLTIPPLDILDVAAASLIATATAAEQRALVKAQYFLHRGIEVVAVSGGLLIPGSSGVIHKVASDGTCTCPASGICWHVMSERILIEAQRHTMPKLAPLGERLARARKEIAELWA